MLGVQDNGEISGVEKAAVARIKKDFVTAINNPNKLYPPLYLQMYEYTINDKKVLAVYVPVSSQVCRHRGSIWT